jgi:hypothetical protein
VAAAEFTSMTPVKSEEIQENVPSKQGLGTKYFRESDDAVICTSRTEGSARLVTRYLSSACIQQSSNALHNKRQTAGSGWFFSNTTGAKCFKLTLFLLQ